MDTPVTTVQGPLFWLCTEMECNICKRTNPVGALAARSLAYAEGEDEFEPDDDGGFLLKYIEDMPAELLAAIVARLPTYKLRYSQSADLTYYMTTCCCGARYGDHYVHNKILDVAFRAPGTLRVEKLDIHLPIDLRCTETSSDSIATLIQNLHE